MNVANQTGIFGKLPAHGDFIYRNLPTRFINAWDSWLQGYVSSSQEQLGNDWLDVYLTSPIWRFALSSGVIDEKGWAGIILPSVDRVGRYFPFSVARALPPGVAPTDVIADANTWFEAIEGAALSALEGALNIDDLMPELASAPMSDKGLYRQVENPQSTLGSIIKTDCEERPATSVIPYFLDALLRDSLRSYSIWSTRGSSLVDPCLFYTPGLPQRRGLAAMLDGTWQSRGWQEPFVLRSGSTS